MIFYSVIKLLLFLLLFVYPFGFLALKFLKVESKGWERFIFSINIGIVFVTIIALGLGYIGLSKILPFALLLPVVYLLFETLVRNPRAILEPLKKIRVDIYVIVSILLVVLLSCTVNFYSGEVAGKGLRLLGAHSVDSLWHISIINSLEKNIPPENPVFSGQNLYNYHFFNDLFITTAIKITGISVWELYFKLIPPLLLILLTSSCYLFIKHLTDNKFLGILAIVLVNFSSSFYYLAGFFYPSVTLQHSVFWVDEYSTRMVNLQLMTSYILILTLLFLMLKVDIKKNLKFVLIFGVLLGSMIEFKAFGFVVTLLSLGGLAVTKIINHQLLYFYLCLVSLGFALVFYLPFVLLGQANFMLAPFWFIKTMYEAKDRINYDIWELKRQTFLAGENYIRIGFLYLEGVVVFLLGNLGGKVLGLLSILNKKEGQEEKDVRLVLFFMSLIGFILPMVFIQRGVVWNSIQFFYYSVFSLGLLTVLFLGMLRSRRIVSAIVGLLIFASLAPGVVHTINVYAKDRDILTVTEVYLAASFLKDQDDGVVLIHPEFVGNSQVSAISKKTSFFADETALQVILVDPNRRKKELSDFFTKTDYGQKRTFMEKNHIKYLFTRDDYGNEFNKIYDNHIKIYKL